MNPLWLITVGHTLLIIALFIRLWEQSRLIVRLDAKLAEHLSIHPEYRHD